MEGVELLKNDARPGEDDSSAPSPSQSSAAPAELEPVEPLATEVFEQKQFAPAPLASPDAQDGVASLPPSSPLLAPTGTGGATWQRDEDVSQCPLCDQVFHPTFLRKHHCRHCGRIVCNECSATRARLPGVESARKERVCDTCVPTVMENQAASFLEDSEASSEIVQRLRAALSETDRHVGGLKQAIQELGATTGTSSIGSAKEPPVLSDFTAFQEERTRAWRKLLDQVETARHDLARAEKKKDRLLQNKEQLVAVEHEMLEQQRSLEEEHVEVVRLLASKDEIWRERNELSSELEEVRRTIMTLELQRKESSETAARQQMSSSSSSTFLSARESGQARRCTVM